MCASRLACVGFVGALLAVYLMAILFPGPGNLLRTITFPGLISQAPNPLSHLVLGGLLFCAGLTVETARMPQLRLRMIPGSLVAVWAIPFLIVLGVSLFAKTLGVQDGVLVGLIIAAGMPIANASVGWAHLAGGSLPLILTLLLGATISAPFIAPVMMQTLAGLCLSDSASIEGVLPLQQLARFLGFWVVTPTLLGVLVGAFSRRQGVIWSTRWLRRVSLFCLLLLNYMNASLALPYIKSGTLVLQGALSSFAVIALLLVGATLFAKLFRYPLPERVALSLACGMRNTGAALVLAGTQFQQDPTVMMTILLQTLLQNLLAAVFVSSLVQSIGTEQANSSSSVPEAIETT